MRQLVPPRSVPTRDEKYMGLAFWMASFSKDPHTQMGAVIIGAGNFPLGWGYNGPPRGISDQMISWGRPEKYDFMMHAEENAIAHSSGDLANATMFVTGKPCKKCMLIIANSGIKTVVYFPHTSSDKNSMFSNGEIGELTDEIAKLAGVTLRKFDGNLNWMRDRVDEMYRNGVFD